MNRYTKPEFARHEFSKAERERQFAQVAGAWNQAKLEDVTKWQRFATTFQRNNEFARRQREEQIERQCREALDAKLPAELAQTEDDQQEVLEFIQDQRKSGIEERKAKTRARHEAEARRLANTVIPLPREILQTVEMRENERGAYLPFRVCDRPFHLMKAIPPFPRRAKKIPVGGKP